MSMSLEISRARDAVVIRFPKPMKAVSTLPIISDNGVVESMVFRFVSKDFHQENIMGYYHSTLMEFGLRSGIVFITAAPMENFHHFRLDDIDSEIFMSIGLSPVLCMETRVYEPMKISTINIGVVVRKPLSHNAMIDLLKTVVEAKSIASSDAMLRCGTRSCGTVTDAIAILKPLDLGDEILFIGMATTIGNSIARTVHRAIMSMALRNKSDVLRNMIGVGCDELLEMFMKIYRYMPIPGVGDDIAREIAGKILDKVLADPNVWSFMVAAREVDLHGVVGSILGIDVDEFRNDSPRIVADEIIGMGLATYLAGMKGLFSMYWVERLKERGVIEHRRPGVFEDDIISAILGSLYTMLYDYVKG